MEKGYGWKAWNLDGSPLHYEGDGTMKQFTHRSCGHPSLEKKPKMPDVCISCYTESEL